MEDRDQAREPAADRFLLKDLFNRDSVASIAAAVAAGVPGFDPEEFLRRTFDPDWQRRELKQRIRHIATVLHTMLTGDYRQQLAALLAAADHAPKGFQSVVFSDFVEAYGLGDWEASVPALARFTRLESAEFAIRHFIASDQERTLAQMLEWAGDPDSDVRRLASEGSRPRLPWGIRLRRLVEDPAPMLPILERLRDDPSEVVRRSVANNLNDISKDHPDVVVDLLKRWDPQPGTDLHRLAGHALRTLLKRGHPQALRILGFEPRPAVEVERLELVPASPSIGGGATLTFSISSRGPSPVVVIAGYAIHYVKAGGAKSAKVFRIGAVTLAPGVPATLQRSISFRQMTTRTHRPGMHKLEVLANGSVVGSTEFELRPPG